MKFTKTPISGAFIVEIEKHRDERGFFGRIFCARQFRELGLKANIAQANTAFSRNKGTLRGLHYQRTPFQEAKLVRCIQGKIYDVFVDLRKESDSYGRWFGARLEAGDGTMIYAPEGTAHGYLTLSDNAEIIYFVSQFYSPDSEQGIRWDDPAFNIEWPFTEGLIISEKDRTWPDFTL